MIEIKKSETADTRTCDFKNVSINLLTHSTHSHVADVRRGMRFFSHLLDDASEQHDHTKFSEMAWFHREFVEGFKTQTWYEMHKQTERHHCSVPEGVRDDINLIDVLEYITDCVMAGMARSGSVYDLKLDPSTLQKAFENTVTLLKNNVKVSP